MFLSCSYLHDKDLCSSIDTVEKRRDHGILLLQGKFVLNSDLLVSITEAFDISIFHEEPFLTRFLFQPQTCHR